MAIDPKAKKTLDNRLASGDIDEDEYRRLLRVLSDEEQNVEQNAATSSQSAKPKAVKSHSQEAVPPSVHAAAKDVDPMKRLLEQSWYAFMVPGIFVGAALFLESSISPKYLFYYLLIMVGVGVPASFFVYNWVHEEGVEGEEVSVVTGKPSDRKSRSSQIVVLSFIVLFLWGLAIPIKIIPALFPGKDALTQEPLTDAEIDQAAESIYKGLGSDFREWREAIKEGDSAKMDKYKSRITVEIENNLDNYPPMNHDAIRAKVWRLNVVEN